MNTTVLSQQVQKLGELRSKRKAIEADEDALARSVRSQMSEHGLDAVRGDDYVAALIEQERLVVDPAKFKRAVSVKEFLASATVNISSARRFLGAEKLRRISDVNRILQLRISERRASSRSAEERTEAGQASA